VREGERHDYARFLLALIRNEQGRSEDSQVLRDQTPQDRRHFWSRYFAQGLAPALPYLAANVARACAASADKLGDTCQPHDAVAPPADYAAFEQASRIRTSRNRLASWGPDTASMTLPQLFSTLDIQPGQDVVDLGAGDGWFAVPLARYLGSGTLWANEIDDGLVDYLGFAASYHELPNLVPVRGSATDLGVEPASVDLVFASDVLSLVYSQGQDPKPLLASIQRSLRPGGRLLILDAASAKDADRGLDADRLAADLLATGLTATEAPPLQLTAGRIVLVFRKG
jgi:SAM-dependent methyltransferase